MSALVERAEKYFPHIIETLDDEGRTIVRASRDRVSREWTAMINTSPRLLPDLHIVGRNLDPTMVRNLVQVLTKAIEDRGWGPTYSMGGTWTAGTITNGKPNTH